MLGHAPRSPPLRKQKALDQIEPHLAHRQKIRSRLDPFSDSTCAIEIGEVKDSSIRPHIARFNRSSAQPAMNFRRLRTCRCQCDVLRQR